METSEVQRIVDSLSSRLERSVTIGNDKFELLASSRGDWHLDDVRVKTILTHSTSPDVRLWLERHGIKNTNVAVRIPPNEELKFESRICAPIRYGDRLFGFVWVLDPDEKLQDDTYLAIQKAADGIAPILHREEVVHTVLYEEREALVHRLLYSSQSFRTKAADDLLRSSHIRSGSVIVIVWSYGVPVKAGGVATTQRKVLQLERILLYLRYFVSPGGWLQFVDEKGPEAIAIVLPPELDSEKEFLFTEVNRAAEQFDNYKADPIYVGISDEPVQLEDSVTGYWRAKLVIRVAESMGRGCRWSQAGVYRLLTHLDLSDPSLEELPSGLKALLERDPEKTLWKTIESYLDNAGSATITADQLSIHRATLYYRLAKIEEITGLDLQKDGFDRLTAHLAVKLARLAGLLR